MSASGRAPLGRPPSVPAQAEAASTIAAGPCGTATPSAVETLSVVDRLRRVPEGRVELVAMLAEQAPVYQGLSTAAAEELRSCILASLRVESDQDPVVPIALEELDTSANPRVVAAAARALRTLQPVSDDVASVLARAIERMRHADDIVRLELDGEPTTAVSESLQTLAAFGRSARGALGALRALLESGTPAFSAETREDAVRTLAALDGIGTEPRGCCCTSRPIGQPSQSAARAAQFPSIEFEDQDGQVIGTSAYLGGRPSVVAFFYTRCTNPAKCSLTVTKLAELAGRLLRGGLADRVNVAAISYDPVFDVPERLRGYGADRGLAFGDRVRLLRTIGSPDALQSALDLSVGYGAATVNQHGRDMLLLDAAMAVRSDYARRNWTPEDIVVELEAMLRS